MKNACLFFSKSPHRLRHRGRLLGVLASGLALLFGYPDSSHAVEAPSGPRGNITITVQDVGSGNVRYSLGGSATNNTGSNRSIYRVPNDALSYAPASGEIPGWQDFTLPPGLRFDTGTPATSGGDPFSLVFTSSNEWYLGVNSSIVRLAPGETAVGSGAVTTDLVPFSAFVPGTFFVEDANSFSWFDATYIVIPFRAPATGGGSGSPSRPASFLVVDSGAINSASTSGLSTAAASRQLVQSVGSGVFRDLNNRLFRARGAAQPGQTGAVIEVIPEGDSSKESFEEQVQAEERAAHRRFELFTEFDYGFYDQSRLNTGPQGYEVDTYAGTIGGEMRPSESLAFGLAGSYVDSDASLDNNFGSVDSEGYFITGYVSANHNNFWGDLLYSYGAFDVDTNRNTFLGPRSRGSTEADLHYLALNIGYTVPIGNQLTLGPWGSLDYLNGSIDGYTETGNARANLIFPEDSFESLTSRLGLAITHAANVGDGVRVTTQVRAAWAHEFMPDRGAYGATLETSPFTLVSGSRARPTGSFTASSADNSAGADWLELGAGVRLDLRQGFNISLDYEGAFARSGIDAHLVALTLGFEW